MAKTCGFCLSSQHISYNAMVVALNNNNNGTDIHFLIKSFFS